MSELNYSELAKKRQEDIEKYEKRLKSLETWISEISWTDLPHDIRMIIATGEVETRNRIDKAKESLAHWKQRESEEDCSHKNNETIPIPGTVETITICHDCTYEI